jgi:hypothetical protein
LPFEPLDPVTVNCAARGPDIKSRIRRYRQIFFISLLLEEDYKITLQVALWSNELFNDRQHLQVNEQKYLIIKEEQN